MPHSKSKADVIRLMSECFGEHKAAMIFQAAAAELGYSQRESYSIDEVSQMLTHLSQAPGLIGISARFAQSRLEIVWGNHA